jgi:hypothetical protein
MPIERKGVSYHLKLEIQEGSVTCHDYGIRRTTWLRAIKFMDHFGPRQALEVIDQRAERAADRGDYKTASRWRCLITAIHAIQEEDRLWGEAVN